MADEEGDGKCERLMLHSLEMAEIRPLLVDLTH